MLSLLLDAGADPKLSTADGGVCPLWKAAELGDAPAVSVLLAHNADPNQATADRGATPLYAAAIAAETEESSGSRCIRVLLCSGANPHLATAETQVTPLSRAATYGSPVKSLQMLAIFGASTTQADLTGVTPLGYATSERNEKAVAWLQAVEGWSPLRIAVAAAMPEMAAIALRLGRMDPDVAPFGSNRVRFSSSSSGGGLGDGGGTVGIDGHGGGNDKSDSGASATTRELLAVRAELACFKRLDSKYFLCHQIDFRFADPLKILDESSVLVGAGAGAGTGKKKKRSNEQALIILSSKVKAAQAATARFAKAATSGWTTSTHWLHHSGFRTAIAAVLYTSERLRRDAYESGCGGSGGGGSAVEDADAPARASTALHVLPVLPPEMWLVILTFCLRSWWGVPKGVITLRDTCVPSQWK